MPIYCIGSVSPRLAYLAYIVNFILLQSHVVTKKHKFVNRKEHILYSYENKNMIIS